MSEACLEKTTHSDSQRYREALRQSPYIATANEAMKNYKENWAGVWFNENVDASDPAGNFAFQRLRHTWFTPRIDPKFRLRRDDKFYAIGSCFVRGLENALKMHKVAVESAAPELARLQPAKKEISPIGFANKYNTYSMLNELRWALDPDAEFPRDSIVPLTKTTWYDPHTNPTLEFADLEETLERRAGWERQFVIAEPGLGRPLHLDPHRDHRGFDLLHDVAEADGLLRKLLSLLGQILRMRGTGEEIFLRRRVRREEGCGAETSDSRRQQRHAPRGQAAA
jgi:hypothetical protein